MRKYRLFIYYKKHTGPPNINIIYFIYYCKKHMGTPNINIKLLSQTLSSTSSTQNPHLVAFSLAETHFMLI